MPLGPGVTAFVGRNGQGKTNLVEAVDYIARLVLAPGRRRRSAGAVRRRPRRRPRGGGAGRPRGGARGADQPGPVEQGAGEPVAAAPGARAARPGAHGAVLAGGPGAGQGRPVRAAAGSSTTCWCSARRGSRGCGPTTTGCSSSATRCSRRPASPAARAAAPSPRCPRSASGTRTSPAPAPSCCRPGWSWSTTCGPTSRELRGGRRGSHPQRRDDDLQAVLRAAGGRGSPTATTWPRRLLAEVERRRDEEVDRGISLVGPHRDDLTLMIGPLPVKGYASHGESWSMALALRLASYDLLRAGGDDPILILDDVFAELDTERREQLAELVAGAEQVLVTAAVPDDVPAALAGARHRRRRREGAARCRLTEPRRRPRPSRRRAARRAERTTTPGSTWPAASPGRWPGPARGAGGAAGRRRSSGPSGRRVDPQASGAHPDERDPQLLDATIGRLIAEQGWGTDVRGPRRVLPVGRDGRQGGRPALHPRGVRRRPSWWSAPTPRRGRPR